MDAQARQSLARLIRTQRIAALGTIRDTAPLVSMVLYVAAADLSSFYIHVSQLAQHTQPLRQDRRVSLLIVEPDSGETDPEPNPLGSIFSDHFDRLTGMLSECLRQQTRLPPPLPG